MTREDVVALLASHEEQRRQLEWFKRQLFGEKSERRLVDAEERQMYLGEAGGEEAAPEGTCASTRRCRWRRSG